MSDIPLSQTKNHVKNFGSYAIGLKKEWALKNKINPVFYICDNTAPTNYIFNILKGIAQIKSQNDSINNTQLLINFFDLVSFLKSYNGYPWDKRKHQYSLNKVTYYNEREWRYVPRFKVKNNKRYLPILDSQNFKKGQIEKLNLHNRKLQEEYVLPFNASDIDYIILNGRY